MLTVQLTLQVLHDSTEAVAVSCDDDVLPCFDFRSNDVVPERQGTCDGVLQRLTRRKLTGLQALVTSRLVVEYNILLWNDWKIYHQGSLTMNEPTACSAERCSTYLTDDFVVRVLLIHGRRWDIEGTAPDLHLLLAVLFSRLCLVEASEASVVTFVQAPGTDHRQPHLVRALHDGPQGLDGPFKHRGVAHVKLHARLFDGLRSTLGLLQPLLTEVSIKPAAEAVLLVPGAFAVSDDNQAMNTGHFSKVPPKVSLEPDTELSALLSCSHTLADQQ